MPNEMLGSQKLTRTLTPSPDSSQVRACRIKKEKFGPSGVRNQDFAIGKADRCRDLIEEVVRVALELADGNEWNRVDLPGTIRVPARAGAFYDPNSRAIATDKGRWNVSRSVAATHAKQECANKNGVTNKPGVTRRMCYVIR